MHGINKGNYPSLFNMFLFLFYLNTQTVFVVTKCVVMSRELNAG
jgi:hypothetical protein